MINLYKVIVVVLLVFTHAFSSASQVKATIRKPNQVSNGTIVINVIYGDRTTVFAIHKDKAGGHIDFSNNVGMQSSKILSQENYDYLVSRVGKLVGPSNQNEFCPRSYIEMKTDSDMLLGCLGAKNKLARDLQDIANLLSGLI